MNMDSGVEYKVTEEGLEILLKGEQFKQLGLNLKSGINIKPFLKSVKNLVKELNILMK